MRQIEKNIIQSFNKAKHDIRVLQAQVDSLMKVQRNVVSSRPEKKIIIQRVNARKKTNFLAAKTGKKFHLPSCPFAKNIKPKAVLKFKSKNKALNQGLKPCRCVS